MKNFPKEMQFVPGSLKNSNNNVPFSVPKGSDKRASVKEDFPPIKREESFVKGSSSETTSGGKKSVSYK